MQFIKCGVPQGSVLGPVLVLLFINDICNVSNLVKFVLFDDYTNIFCSNENIEVLQDTLNRELAKLFVWFSINKLSLNLGKTNYMLFRSRPPDLELHLKINNADIPKVTATKFLGIIIDDRLNWKPHIQSVKSKLSCILSIYPIICLKSVCLYGDVRTMQFAILAQSPREMSQTDRIHPRYFLSRVRVSIRPRFFLYAKKTQTSPRMLQRHRPSERRNVKRSLYLHARWRLTSDDFVGAPKPAQSKKKLSALQRSSQARQRMRSIREEAAAPGANTTLTLQVPTRPTGQTL